MSAVRNNYKLHLKTVIFITLNFLNLQTCIYLTGSRANVTSKFRDRSNITLLYRPSPIFLPNPPRDLFTIYSGLIYGRFFAVSEVCLLCISFLFLFTNQSSQRKRVGILYVTKKLYFLAFDKKETGNLLIVYFLLNSYSFLFLTTSIYSCLLVCSSSYIKRYEYKPLTKWLYIAHLTVFVNLSWSWNCYY